MVRQRTLKNVINATGIGIHSGKEVLLTLRPAAVDSGVVFRRVDLPGTPSVKACALNVCETTMATTLADGDCVVSTVEHLMAALAGLGVDNCIVDVSAAEIPIMDGSAAPFVFLLQSAGITEQMAPKRFVKVLKTIEIRDGDNKWVKIEPSDGFKIDFQINFDHPVFRARPQNCVLNFSTTAFVKELSRARTFGFVHELAALNAQNLALGGGVDNAVVLDDTRVLNAEGLRYENEFVKHKMLDAVGDLYLLGHSLLGAFSASCSGHRMNNQLLRALLADPDAWVETSYQEARQSAPIQYAEALAYSAA